MSALKSKSTSAAWWNGAISPVLLFDIGWLLRNIYVHDWDGITFTTLLGGTLFIVWFASLVSIEN